MFQQRLPRYPCLFIEQSTTTLQKSLQYEQQDKNRIEEIVSENNEDIQGCTLLHLAAWLGNTDVIKVLIETGASLSSVDNKGWTPLHLSAWKGNTDLTRVLLEAGASLSAVDNEVINPSVKLIQSNIKLFK